MNDFKRNSFWFWGFIVLLIINISAMSAMLFINYRIHNNMETGYFHSRTFKHKQTKRHNIKNKSTKAWSELNFTKEQKMFLKSERKKHIEQMRLLKDKLRKNQSTLFDELAKGENNKVENSKVRFIQIHKKILEENIHFYEQLKSKLSEEQMQAIRAHIERQFQHSETVSKYRKAAKS